MRQHEDRMFKLWWTWIERPKRLLESWLLRIFRVRQDNRVGISREVDAHRGRLVLMFGEVHRLLGWSEDSEDYWYVTIDKQRRIIRHSCVGGFVPLYGALPGFDYWQLAHWWNLNGQSYENGLRAVEECAFRLL